ncbi:MAG: hypothetical protein [Caudoviricetes sp.]|nr:MAG: hypothetical protein [Caudoviricetes sp.]QHJ85236.1 MAG: hypothetical protein [Caudoviricetes sp.]
MINQDAFLKPANVSMYVFQALTTGLVSYTELFKMSLEDVLNVIEIDQIKRQHEQVNREIRDAQQQ